MTPHFGQQLKAARLRQGMTQAEAAKRGGISQGAWSRHERTANVQLDTAHKLAAAMGLSLSEVLAEAQEVAPSPDPVAEAQPEPVAVAVDPEPACFQGANK